MAGNYIESQTPIMQNGDFYYPLTTAKQLILPDGRRLGSTERLNITADDVDALSIDLTDAEPGSATGVNADTLGGKTASDYVLETDFDTYKSEISSDYATKNEVIENYLLKTETAVDSNLLGGKAPQYYIQPYNLLDNSNFTNPVNQRGLTRYTGNAYTIDRWVAYSPTGTVAVTVGSNGIIVNPGADGEASFTQRFPADSLPDGDYTFAWMDGSGVVHIDNNPINIQGEIKYVGVILNSETVMVWAALYEGEYTSETLPPYVSKGYAAELMECQRYYIPNVGAGCSGYGISGQNYLIAFIPTPVEMRANPALVIAAQDNVVLYNNIIAVTGVNGAYKRPNGVLCNFALASNFTTHGAGILGGSTSVNFIADL